MATGSKTVVVASSSKFGDVVWARTVKSHPWWPSFICDPTKLRIAKKDLNRFRKELLDIKKYLVFFYASNSYGFVSDLQIKEYSENRDSFATEQKSAKDYLDEFQQAVSIADTEIKLNKTERNDWINFLLQRPEFIQFTQSRNSAEVS